MFILASSSPRRRELFKIISNNFKIIPSLCDEIVPPDISYFNSPIYLAELKANEVAKKYPNDTIIGADTSVIIDNNILGKPKNYNEAFNMLNSLSGRIHKVITGCAIINKNALSSFSVCTEVEFFKLTKNDINNYIKTNEPFDKAGGYGIQGLGGLFVKRINGDYFNVVGLPISTLNKELLKRNLI